MLRTFNLRAERIGLQGTILAQWERTLEFDDPGAYDLPGLEHELREPGGCSHCDLKRDAYARDDGNFRAGHAFARWLDGNEPAGFVDGMKSCRMADSASWRITREN